MKIQNDSKSVFDSPIEEEIFKKKFDEIISMCSKHGINYQRQ
jgi:hypothetical protein